MNKRVMLKDIATYLGLSPATISLVLNDSPIAQTIPQTTQDRVKEAAKKFNYRPSHLARSLRTRKSFTIGVTIPDVGGWNTSILEGIESCLLNKDYLYFVTSHKHKSNLIEKHIEILKDRAIDGLVIIDSPCKINSGIPTVIVSGCVGVRQQSLQEIGKWAAKSILELIANHSDLQRTFIVDPRFIKELPIEIAAKDIEINASIMR